MARVCRHYPETLQHAHTFENVHCSVGTSPLFHVLALQLALVQRRHSSQGTAATQSYVLCVVCQSVTPASAAAGLLLLPCGNGMQ
jgi:hypothetical protein